MPPAGSSKKQPANRALRWIGALQLIKGFLLVALALGLLSFLHRDVDEIVGAWMGKAGVNLESQRVVDFLEFLNAVTDKQLFQASIFAFFFAGLLVTQGTGLLLRQQWGKYLTLAGTSALIPFEAFELAKGFGYVKLAVLVVNVAIVTIMLLVLRRQRNAAPATSAVSRAPSPVFAGSRRLPEAR